MTKDKLQLALIFLVTAVLAISGAPAVLAADLTFATDTTVSLTGPSINLTVIAGSTAISQTVDATTVTVTTGANDTYTITSADRYTLNNNLSLAPVCFDSYSRLRISGARTVIITPLKIICTSSSGGWSGGGVGPSTPVVALATPAVSDETPATPATPATSATLPTLKALPFPVAKTVAEMQANLTVLLENLAALQAYQKAVAATQVPSVVSTAGSIPPAGSYKVGLTTGSKGNDVTALQNFLKSQSSEIYPEGLITGYYGNLTKAAVGRFQLKNGVVTSASDPGYGYVGPKTRAKINTLLDL